MRARGVALVLCAVACVTRPSEDSHTNPVSSPDAGPAAPSRVTLFDRVRISSHPEDPHFQGATVPLSLDDGPYQSVILDVQLESSCFPFSGWSQDPPPPGQNWPPSCDAFDRNYELVLDPAATETDVPGVELMRAITPFGGPLVQAVDITHVANARPGLHTLRVHITTWSDGAGQVSGSAGGWWVTGTVHKVPGAAPRRVLAVIPLFDGILTPENPAANMPVDVPEGTTHAVLEVRVTGHGGGQPTAGCIGPSDEFCRRTHRLWLDGLEQPTWTPWRDDCNTLCTVRHQDNAGAGFDYCLENPCGAMQSVTAPRANWCPGSLTPPHVVDTGWTAGPHEVSWQVDRMGAGGSWRTSVLLLAYGD
jgi:hypothetical protein